MNISKAMLAIIVSAILSTSAFAQQQAPAQGGGAQGQGGGAAAAGAKLDVTAFFTAVDTNKDGSISSAEWKDAGLDDTIYSIFDKDKKGSFAKDTMAGMNHPAEIDANKDGKLTLDEFTTYLKSQNKGSGGAAGGAQGAGPGGAQGGAPAK
jgi:hypothetical protein